MNVIFKLIVMNIYTHLEKLEKINAYAELIKDAKNRLVTIHENEQMFKKLDFLYTGDSFYKKRMASTEAALTRIEKRYKHLVSELYKISM